MAVALEKPVLDAIQPAEPMSLTERSCHFLFQPVDIASVAIFRILFGAAMVVETSRYFVMGWIPEYYLNPGFHFSYYGFDWVKPWPGIGMYIHFAVLGIAALGVMLGAWYRVCAATLFLSFTYVFLLDQAYYLNHFYLISLLALLMIFIPAHRALSLDVLRRPSLRSNSIPAWCLWLLLAQLSIVYFYAGLAKLNTDWVHGEPMRAWLAERTHIPVMGQFFTEEWFVLLFNYGGLAFDLFIVPLLLWKRTRVLAFLWVVAFHLLNATLFSIGIFPWLMLAATLLYFRPDWPRRLFRWARSAASSELPRVRRCPRMVLAALGAYVALQLLIPLRHFLYPGNVHWTEEGHRFSWHMKLREKQATARFFVTDPVRATTWQVHPRSCLNVRQTNKMSTRPDMILQFAHYLAREQGIRRKVNYPLEVRAYVTASLHGRPSQLLVDPKVNLAAQTRSLRHAKWVLPFDHSALSAERTASFAR